MNHRRISLIVLLLAALTGVTSLLAQNASTAELVGTITDPSGAVTPGAEVTVVSDATGALVKTRANGVGSYNVPFLQPGAYHVSVELQGFEQARFANVVLTSGQTARIDVRLKLGQTAETATVVETTAVMLGTDSAERGTEFGTHMVDDLPVFTRDANSIAILAPGTSTAQAGDPRTGDDGRYSVNGERAFSISATVNGGSVVLPTSDNYSFHAPALADVAEFSVIQDNFSAEYGNGTSVITMISKSGTNEYHGQLFEFVQNNDLNARNFFAQGVPELRHNQYGAAGGGPIKKNRAFFFFSWERSAQPMSNIDYSTVPTVAAKNGDFSGFSTVITNPATGQPFAGNVIPASQIDPVAKAAEAYFPDPNLPGTTNNYYRNAPTDTTIPIYDAKVDLILTDNNQLSYSGHQYWSTTNNNGGYPGDVCVPGTVCGLNESHDQSYQLSDRWTLSPDKVNEFHVNFVREHFESDALSFGKDYPSKLGLNNVPDFLFPQFSMQGAINTAIGPGNYGGSSQDVYNEADTFLWVKGSHTLKFGGDFNKAQLNSMASWGAPTFNFSGAFSGMGYSDFLLGLPNQYSLSASPNGYGARRTYASLFVQDDYRVSSRMTLNLGLRYQFEGGFSEVYNRLSNFDPNLTNPATGTPGAIEFADQPGGQHTLQENHPALFAPRIGLAYSLRKDIVLRAGYGIFYVPINGEDLYNSSPPGYSISQNLQSTNNTTPVFQLSAGPPPFQYPSEAGRTPDILNGQGIDYWPFHAAQGYSQEWHFSVQKQINDSSMLEVAYVGTKGSNLMFPRDINQVPQNELGPGDAQSKEPYPQYQSIFSWGQDGYSNYNALQVQYKHRFSQGLTALVNYTLSKSLDDNSFELTAWGGMQYQVAANPSLNYGLSQFDQTHRLVAAYVYEIPVGKGHAVMNRGGIADAVLGGWQTSGTFTWNTGAPFTVYDGGANLTNDLDPWGSVYENRLANGSLPSGQQTVQHWFDTSAFADPAPYQFGNAGRNILRGPGYVDMDVSLMKDFRIPVNEKTKLEFKADAFNVFNHPNFASIDSSSDNSLFGAVTSAHDGRSLQLGLQLFF